MLVTACLLSLETAILFIFSKNGNFIAFIRQYLGEILSKCFRCSVLLISKHFGHFTLKLPKFEQVTKKINIMTIMWKIVSLKTGNKLR